MRDLWQKCQRGSVDRLLCASMPMEYGALVFMSFRVGGLLHSPRYHVALPTRSSFMPTDPLTDPIDSSPVAPKATRRSGCHSVDTCRTCRIVAAEQCEFS